MYHLVVPIVVIAVLALVATVELAATVLPLNVVISLVRPEEREGLAELIAAIDSSGNASPLTRHTCGRLSASKLSDGRM